MIYSYFLYAYNHPFVMPELAKKDLTPRNTRNQKHIKSNKRMK